MTTSRDPEVVALETQGGGDKKLQGTRASLRTEQEAKGQEATSGSWQYY